MPNIDEFDGEYEQDEYSYYEQKKAERNLKEYFSQINSITMFLLLSSTVLIIASLFSSPLISFSSFGQDLFQLSNSEFGLWRVITLSAIFCCGILVAYLPSLYLSRYKSYSFFCYKHSFLKSISLTNYSSISFILLAIFLVATVSQSLLYSFSYEDTNYMIGDLTMSCLVGSIAVILGFIIGTKIEDNLSDKLKAAHFVNRELLYSDDDIEEEIEQLHKFLQGVYPQDFSSNN